ncbi:MAG: long-chain fatty acid--CoA ligase [Burkholderiaceae bacterium]
MQTPWLNAYPPGIRWDAELAQFPLSELLASAVRRWPERPAIDFMGRKLSFSELDALVDRAAVGLQQLGVAPGVHVGLFLPNAPQYIIAFFAILRAGGVVVNYSPLDAGAVLAHKIEDSRTDLVITLDLASLYPQMHRLLNRSRLKTIVVGSLGEFGAAPGAVQAKLRQDGQLADVAFGEQVRSFEQLLDNAGGLVPPAVADLSVALAILQYTGGTTGLPKGAMLTHANLSAAVSQLGLTYAGGGGLLNADGTESLLVALPLFHIYALVCCMLFPMWLGAEMVLVVKFDAAAAMREIHERRISCFPGVPTMFTAIVAHPDVERFDLRSLKVCTSGGAPLPVELLQRFMSLTGCKLTEGWGMTETSSVGTFTPMFGEPRPGSCGVPQINVAIKFLDVDDPTRTLPPGERGEIAIAGPNVLQGYWNSSHPANEVFTADGFFRTGDVGCMDTEGYIYIVDRTKDMLLCGGFNVYPRVIEEAIYAHSAVEEVLVIGIADAYRGQSPKAYIKLRTGSGAFTLDELKDFLRDKLGKHEMVQALEFREALPKTPVGKLSKRMLLDELAARESI